MQIHLIMAALLGSVIMPKPIIFKNMTIHPIHKLPFLKNSHTITYFYILYSHDFIYFIL